MKFIKNIIINNGKEQLGIYRDEYSPNQAKVIIEKGISWNETLNIREAQQLIEALLIAVTPPSSEEPCQKCKDVGGYYEPNETGCGNVFVNWVECSNCKPDNKSDEQS